MCFIVNDPKNWFLIKRRKIIQCALARQDFATAREIHSKMPDTGKDEPVTRYLMYKVSLQSGDADFAAECLDVVCQNSSKDATLLYACVMEAQSAGDRWQAAIALERVLDRYDYSAPTGIHLPALLRFVFSPDIPSFVKLEAGAPQDFFNQSYLGMAVSILISWNSCARYLKEVRSKASYNATMLTISSMHPS